MQRFTVGIVQFLVPLQKVSRTSIRQLCMDSHVSTRTYAKIVKLIPVKHECYYRLLVGLCHAANYEEFMEHWNVLGEDLYWKYSAE